MTRIEYKAVSTDDRTIMMFDDRERAADFVEMNISRGVNTRLFEVVTIEIEISLVDIKEPIMYRD